MKEVTARFWVAFSGVDRSDVFSALRKFVPEKEAHDRLWDRFVNHMHREDDHDDYSTVAGSVEVADIDDLFDVLNVVREAKPYDYSIRVGVDRGPIRASGSLLNRQRDASRSAVVGHLHVADPKPGESSPVVALLRDISEKVEACREIAAAGEQQQ